MANSPQYLAIRENRVDLEKKLPDYLDPIVSKLRDTNFLTELQAKQMTTPTKLVEAVLLAIEEDPEEAFSEAIAVMKACGNKFFVKFLERIEDRAKPKSKSDATPSQTVETKSDKKSATSSIETLCSKYGLSMNQLDQEISEEDILEIYPQLENWLQVAPLLGLTPPDLEAIKHKAMGDVKLMRMYMLQEWKSRSLLSGQDTYRVLLDALVKSQSTKTVKHVCEMLQRK